METDTTNLIGRVSQAGTKRGFALDGTPQADTRPVLMWLAGAGYRPSKNRSKTLRPTAKSDEAAADRILRATRPDDPVMAAHLRAGILVDLHRDAMDDPRTRDIFDADPLVVADPRTGWLVTESILAARVGLFDSLNTLLQKPYLEKDACDAMRDTLIAAFPHLDADAQREWCHSEVRLEQGLAFLESRKPSDLVALAEELRPVDAVRGLWDTIRLFSIAAQMGDTSGTEDVPVAGLLTMRTGPNRA